MATPQSTLTNLWLEDGHQGPRNPQAVPLQPTAITTVSNSGIVLNSPPPTSAAIRSASEALHSDLSQFYRSTGLEPVAREAGIINVNGGLVGGGGGGGDQGGVQRTKTVQMIQMVTSPAKSPFKMDGIPRIVTVPTTITGSPMIVGTPQRVIQGQVVNSPRGATTQLIATPVSGFESPQAWSSRKRPHELISELDYSDGKRGRKQEKGGKGLRHFSMKVCEKVQKKVVTSYNEVADELVMEFSDPRNVTPTDQAYDQKNIRRRVYDALNVLMAMNIISKEKKEIRWIGLPTNSAQECHNLEMEKQRRLDLIKNKTQQLQELILQQIAFKNLVQRNRALEQSQGPPKQNSAIQLPFIIVNTSKKTVIDCSISNDKYEYLFNFDNTFEIHDDIEVLKRMGMAFGLEKNRCGADDLRRAVKMIPKSLEPYVLELANAGVQGVLELTGDGYYGATLHGPDDVEVKLEVSGELSADSEVALATARGYSRQSSVASASYSRDSPASYSDEGSESERSSPVDMS